MKPQSKNYVVNHINENKLDNHLHNLEYITYSENTKYSANNNRTINNSTFDINIFTDVPNYNKYKVSKNGEIYSKNISMNSCSIRSTWSMIS